MNTMHTSSTTSWKPRVASLIIPILITLLVAILFFKMLTAYQLVGSGILLSVILLSLGIGELKDLPNKDIAILWVSAILYNAYLLSSVF